jgi:hypothetical protein
LALEYANTALTQAREAYQQGRFQQTQEALGQVEHAVAISYESLQATGKNPRKSSKHFKAAEKATRELLRRLSSLRDFMSAADHPIVDPVVSKVTSVHDQLLTGVMTGQ